MSRERYRFGAFELNVAERELRKHGSKIKLQGQPFLVLSRLLRRPNQLVTRQELCSELWPEDTFVDFDHSLNEAVNKVRLALGDSASNPRFVETVPRHGYRFIAPVERESEDGEAVDAGEPVKRPPSRRRFLYLSAGAVLLAAAVATGLLLRRREPDRSIRAIAVLPLDNLSGTVDHDYFADGMTDELIAQMSKIEALRVISRTSVRRYRGSEKSLREIGRELGVDALVEGSVRLARDRVRVTVHLARASTEESLWGETFEGPAEDVLKIQGEIARSIADEILLELTEQDEARLASRGSPSPAAYQAYLKGRFHWNRRNESDFLKAIEYFSEALSWEPRYAEAFAGLADTHSMLAVYNMQRPRRAMPRAREAARAALELRPDLAEAHASYGCILFLYEWDWEGAEAALRRALELNPGYAPTHQWLGILLVSRNRMDEALASLRQAVELDPLSLSVNEVLGWALYTARRYPEAIEQFERTLELDPGFGQALRYLGLTYLHLGREQEALPVLTRARDAFRGDEPEIRADLALAYARSGRTDEAEAILAELLVATETRYVSPYLVASFHTGLGDTEEALDWLERAYEERVSNLIFLGVDPFFDPLRGEPRFDALVSRIDRGGREEALGDERRGQLDLRGTWRTSASRKGFVASTEWRRLSRRRSLAVTPSP